MGERRPRPTWDGGENTAGDHSLVETYRITPRCTDEEFLAAVRLYARGVVDTYDLEATVRDLDWRISRRAKRRAGAVKYSDGEPEAVVLTWDYFEAEGWAAVAETIRHELIHVHLLNETGTAGHGPAFQRLAEALDTTIHCERFTDPKYWVICTECNARLARYRRSKLVKHPDRYVCSDCGGAFRVENNQ